jgi:hypothetical protein
MEKRRARVGLLAVVVVVAGCAVLTGGCATLATPSTWQPGNLQPLVIGWQQYFRIQWSATSHETGGVLIDGYITNTWGFPAQKVRVLVDGYDASGTQVGQLISWGPNEINPGTRVYFDVAVPAGAATYEVSIFSFDWVQTAMNEQLP